jgi:hypothetical protein
MARTAAVVGTATATRNAVNRRQAQKNTQAYADAANTVYTQQAPPPQAPPPQAQYAPEPQYEAAPVDPQEEMIAKLERLGALYAQGILTEEEFAAQKAKILGG